MTQIIEIHPGRRLKMQYRKKKSYAIYRIKSPSGKIYIGKDEYFPSRMNSHRRIAENLRKVEYNSPIHRAIRKYGWSAMVIEVVDQNAKSVAELKRREKIWIRLHDSKRKGYNQTLGGEGTQGFNHSDITKEKLRQMKLGTKMPEDYCRLLGLRRLGSKHSEETKQKIAASNRGKIVADITKQKLRIVRLGKPLSIKNHEAIRVAMKKFSGVPIPAERKQRIKSSHLKREYEFISPDGQRVVRTNDLKTFAKGHALSTQHLYHVLNGKRLHHKGWKGRYVHINGNPEIAERLNEAKPAMLPRLEALRNAVCKFTYEIVSPENKIFVTRNLAEFCRLQGLDQRKMTSVVNGKPGRKFHRGWTGRKLLGASATAKSLTSGETIEMNVHRGAIG
jgi:group I intron endonuclease